MNHTVNALFKLDKGSVSCEVANSAGNVSANRIVVNSHFPRIFLKLAEAKGDLLLFLRYAQDNSFNFVANLQNFRGLGNALCPGELSNVNKAFNTVFKLDECAVIDQVDNFALDVCADRVLALNSVPGVLHSLLQAQGYALALGVDFNYHNIDFFADFQHFRGV